MIIRVYGIEVNPNGSKTVHSFSERKLRASWIAENPTTRSEAIANSRTVLAAKFESEIVAH